MKKGLSYIAVVLDRSGSMDAMKVEAINGFNSFVEDQKKAPGEARLTLAQFDDQYEVVYRDMPIQDVPALTQATYQPRNTTALYDAMGKTIHDLGIQLANTPEDERPETVIFVTMTDGAENASKLYTLGKLREEIQHQENKYNWKFLYLAAGLDAQQMFAAISSAPDAQVCNFAATGAALGSNMKSCSNATRGLRGKKSISGWNKTS